MNILFVCSGNKLRSPTAENVFSKQYNTRSAGTSHNAVNVISIEDIKWADKVIVMETKHKQRILAAFNRAMQFKDLIVLNIPDDFKYMDKKLITILENKIPKLID